MNILHVHSIHTVPVIKKLKYSTAGTERVRSRFARGSLEVRSRFARSSLVVRKACANRYGAGALQVRCGAVRCACAAVIRGRHAHRIRVLTAVEDYPLLRVVGEDHLDHDQISPLGHVNTQCATIRSQYRIAPRRLGLYRERAGRGPRRVLRALHRTARTVPHRTAPRTCIHYCRGSLDVRC